MRARSPPARRAARQRVPFVVLVERGNARDGHVEQRDLRLEDVAKQPGDAQRHVDARPLQQGQGQHLDAGDALDAVSQVGRAPR